MVVNILQLFLHCSFAFLSEYLKDLLDAVLSQYFSFVMILVGGVVSKTISDGVKDIGVGHGDIMEVTGTNNQVNPSYRESIGSFIIVAGVGRIA